MPEAKVAVDADKYNSLLGDFEILRDKVTKLEDGLDAVKDTTNSLASAQRGTAADVEVVKEVVNKMEADSKEARAKQDEQGDMLKAICRQMGIATMKAS